MVRKRLEKKLKPGPGERKESAEYRAVKKASQAQKRESAKPGVGKNQKNSKWANREAAL